MLQRARVLQGNHVVFDFCKTNENHTNDPDGIKLSTKSHSVQFACFFVWDEVHEKRATREQLRGSAYERALFVPLLFFTSSRNRCRGADDYNSAEPHAHSALHENFPRKHTLFSVASSPLSHKKSRSLQTTTEQHHYNLRCNSHFAHGTTGRRTRFSSRRRFETKQHNGAVRFFGSY